MYFSKLLCIAGLALKDTLVWLRVIHIPCICTCIHCDHTGPVFLVCKLGVDNPPTCDEVPQCLHNCHVLYMKACLYVSVHGSLCVHVHVLMHACVVECPYDKWLPGWLKRTLSLHNEHRRSISHCLWGTPGASAAKVPVISRISTNVD